MNTEIQPAVACHTLIVCAKTTINDTNKLLSLDTIYPELGLRLKKEEATALGGEPKYTNIPFEAVFIWKKEQIGAVDETFTVNFLDPTGRVLLKDISARIVMHPEQAQLYSVVRFEKGVPCAGPGTHLFQVQCKEYQTSFGLRIRMFDEEGKEIG